MPLQRNQNANSLDFNGNFKSLPSTTAGVLTDERSVIRMAFHLMQFYLFLLLFFKTQPLILFVSLK